MSCIHYKFKSSLDYNTVTFDGLHLSLADLKKAIGQQKRLKSGEFDLEITNAQTGDVYKKSDELIAKNTSVIVSRVPVLKTTASSTQKSWEAFKQECAKVKEKERQMTLEKLKQTPDLAGAPASEIDKIKAVIDQSTKGFEQSNFVGKHQPHENYVCKHCLQKGHFVTNCPNSNPEDRIVEPRYKRTTGIPSTMLTLVDDPMHPGALLTQYGQFAVPTVDVQGYRETKKERPPFLPGERQPEPEKRKIPQELLCHICEDLCVDAAIAPCCGTSFCDECLREELLESEDHQCPSCKETNVSPDRIVANKSMRLAVINFLNDTGYTKAKRRRSSSQSGDNSFQGPVSKLPSHGAGSGVGPDPNLSSSAHQRISTLSHVENAGGPRPPTAVSGIPIHDKSDVGRPRYPYRPPVFNPQFNYSKPPRFPSDQYSKPWRYTNELSNVPNTISTINRWNDIQRIHAEEAPPASQSIEKSSSPESGSSSPGEPAAPGTSPTVNRGSRQEPAHKAPSTWGPPGTSPIVNRGNSQEPAHKAPSTWGLPGTSPIVNRGNSQEPAHKAPSTWGPPGTSPIVNRGNSQEPAHKAPSTWRPTQAPLLETPPTSTGMIAAPMTLGLGQGLLTHRLPVLTVPPAGHQPFTAIVGIPRNPIPRPGIPVMPPHIPPAVPLSREEFYQAKKMMQQQATEVPKKKPVDVFDSFADFTKKRSYTPERRKSYSRSRSGSWNKRSRSRSLTPIKRKSRSLSPRRFLSRSRSKSRPWSQNRSRSRSPYRSQNRSRSRSSARLQKRSRSRSYDGPKLSRPRSRSRTPTRLSKSRSRSRSGPWLSKVSPRPRSPLPPLRRGSKTSFSPIRRSSKSPLRRSSKSPLRRSSKSPLSLLRRSSKSPLPPLRRSSKSPLPPFRSRSRSRSYRRLSRSRSRSWSKRARSRSYSRPRSPRPLSRSPRRSPLRSPFRKHSFSPKRRSRSLTPLKRSPYRSKSRTPMSKRKSSKSRTPPPKRRSFSPLRSPRRSKSPYKKPLSPPPFRHRSPSPHRGRGGYRGRGRGGYGYRDYNKDMRDRFRSYPSPPRNPATSASAPALPSSNYLPPVPGIPPPEEFFKYNPAGYQAFLRNFYEGIAQGSAFPHQPGEGFPTNPTISDPALTGHRPPWESVPMSPSQRPRSITPPNIGKNLDRRAQHHRGNWPWDRDRGRPERERERDRPEHDRERDRPEHDRERDRPEHDRERDRPEHERERDRPEHDRERGRDRQENTRERERDRQIERGRDSDRYRRDNNRRNRAREDDRSRGRDSHRDNKDRDGIRGRDKASNDKKRSPSKREDEKTKSKDKKKPEKKKDEKENKKTKKRTESETKKESTAQKDSILGKTSPISEKDLESPVKADDGDQKTEKQEILKPKNEVISDSTGRSHKTASTNFSQPDVTDKPAVKEKKAAGKKKSEGVGSKKKVKETVTEDGTGEGDKKVKKTKKKKLTFGADADTKQGLKKKKLKRLVDYKSENCTSEDGEERAARGGSPSKKAKLSELDQIKEEPTDFPKSDQKDSSCVSSSDLTVEVNAEAKVPADVAIHVKEEAESTSSLSTATMKTAGEKVKTESVSELPELSKWEREEDFDYFENLDQPKEKPQEKMMLPRSVVDKAEKFLALKPMKNAVMVAHVTTSTKSPEATSENGAADQISESSQTKTSRRVFVDRKDSKDKRPADLQITVKADKRKSDASDKKVTASTKAEEHHRHHHHHHHDNNDYEEDQRSVVRSHSFERELQDNKTSSKSHRKKDASARGSDDISKQELSKKDKPDMNKDKRSDKSPEHKNRRHSRDSINSDMPSKSSKDLRHKLDEKSKTKSAVDHRKLSVMDESEFIPDYEDLAPDGTSNNDHDDATTSQNSGLSSPEISKDSKKRKREGDDESKMEEGNGGESAESTKPHKKAKKKHKHKEKDKTKEKKEKHKHKKKKHKHKKNKDKEGKQKGNKDDADDST